MGGCYATAAGDRRRRSQVLLDLDLVAVFVAVHHHDRLAQVHIRVVAGATRMARLSTDRRRINGPCKVE